MKMKKNNYTISFLLVFVMLVLGSCTEWDDLESPDEGTVYMAQASGNRSILRVFRIDEPQPFYFGASVAGFNGAPQDMNIHFEIDNSLIAGFNEDNASLGYDFMALPEDAFEITELNSVIKQGNTDSDPLSLVIYADKLDLGVDYCLPVRIKSIPGGIAKLDTSLSTTFFMIDSIYTRSRDVTARGALSVAKDNNGGADAKEGSIKLTDNDYTTKFLYEFDPNTWMQLKLDSAVQISAYTLTSGNDASERDPKSWELQGSNDGDSWVTLDERLDQGFPDRLQTITFELNQPDGNAYSYYRFFVMENNGSSLFQMTEWRLLEYY